MLKNPFIQDFVEQASKVIPGGAQAREDVQKNLQALAQSTLSKLDLVSRDEFEVQAQVLQRTRAKVEALEQQLNQLLEQQQN